MQNEVIGQVLTYKIDTEQPIGLNELISGLNALSDEYIKFSKMKNVDVKISAVRKGSYEFDLILASHAVLLPLMSDINTTLDFIGRIKQLKDYFLNNTPTEIVPTIEEAKMMQTIGAPIQALHNNGGTIIFNIGSQTEALKITQDETKLLDNRTHLYIQQKKQETEEAKNNIFTNRLIKFVQTRADNKDYGNKSICESISKYEIKTIFSNEDIKNNILDNPYHYAYLVDLEVQYIGGDAKIYQIIAINDKVEL